jgi:hypothetical protein
LYSLRQFSTINRASRTDMKAVVALDNRRVSATNQFCFFATALRATFAAAHDPNDSAGTAFAHVVIGLEVFCAASLLRQAHHFFEFKSFSIRTSSDSSATIFFSSVFSRSSSRSFFRQPNPLPD